MLGWGTKGTTIGWTGMMRGCGWGFAGMTIGWGGSMLGWGLTGMIRGGLLGEGGGITTLRGVGMKLV